MVFRCTASEKQALTARAARAGLPFATLMREALGLTEARRRRPVPKVDPELVRAVARIGGNLNQIARWLNTAQAQGQVPAIDAITVAARSLRRRDAALARDLAAIRAASEGRITSDFRPLRQEQGVLYIDAQIPDRVFNPRVTEQNLDGTDIPGRLADH